MRKKGNRRKETRSRQEEKGEEEDCKDILPRTGGSTPQFVGWVVFIEGRVSEVTG